MDLDALEKQLVVEHNQLVQRIELDTANKFKILGKLDLIKKLKEESDGEIRKNKQKQIK